MSAVAIAGVTCDAVGGLYVKLKGSSETIEVRRSHVHLFRQMSPAVTPAAQGPGSDARRGHLACQRDVAPSLSSLSRRRFSVAARFGSRDSSSCAIHRGVRSDVPCQ